MSKKFLLDTNVLIKTPDAMFRFEDNEVCICSMVLRELDKLKNNQGEVGYNAREAIRNIYQLEKTTNTTVDIPLNTGGKFSIISDTYTCDFLPDDIIIATTKEQDAILVTADIAMYLKAISDGCSAQIYANENASEETMLYNGRTECYVDTDTINTLFANGQFAINPDLQPVPHENEYLILRDCSNPSHVALGRKKGQYIVKVSDNIHPKGITAKNVGQKFAIDALTAPVDEIPLTILKGPAGTAKTFLALAAGLDLVEKNVYNKILILRPNIKFDEDIGYLKGDEMEKITPLIRPCLDNLEAILASSIEGTMYARQMVEKLFQEGVVEAEAMAYIRGRSIANSYIIVDEAQNATPKQILGIVTRAGINSKIVVTGDPDQIDNPQVDKRNNGLAYLSDKMLGSSLCAQVGFEAKECVRSKLALEAAERLAFDK